MEVKKHIIKKKQHNWVNTTFLVTGRDKAEKMRRMLERDAADNPDTEAVAHARFFNGKSEPKRLFITHI